MRHKNSSLTHIIKTALTCFVLALMLIPSPALALEKTSIILQWVPQAQFTGFYMAQEKGFYNDAGVDLTIHHGGPDILASEWLETGKAEFATMFLAAALIRRSTLDLVNIGQFVQDSALMLITMADSKITHPQDLDGKKIGLWSNEFQVQPRALFKRLGLDVTVVPQSSSLDLFLRGGVQAATGMLYNEYHLLLSYGIDEHELRPFLFRDTDLNFPEDGIYTLQKTAEAKPELCEAIVTATARGWQYAFENPEEAVDVVMQRMREARIPANRAHQQWMLSTMKDIIATDGGPPLGVLREPDFERTKAILLEMRFMEHAPSFNDFYRGTDQ